jgi:hypothetical protein
MERLRHSDKRYKRLIRKRKAIRKLKQELSYLLYYFPGNL